MRSAENLSDAKLLRYIGRIAITFCELEDVLELGIAEALHGDCDEIGYFVTCKMNFQQKVELYERLIGHRLSDCGESARLKELDNLMIEIKNVQEFRNHVIHGIRFNDDGEIFLRQKYKKNLINYDEGIDEMKLPYKGINSRYPKYKKIELNEATLKKFLRRVEKASERVSEWDMAI
jgi:hypothetical protein